MKCVFWLAAFVAGYSYFIYAGLLMLLPRRRRLGAGPAQASAAVAEPVVSLIITAYNEEARIVDKLRNTGAIDYPEGSLEIIVASDCSDDDTDRLVREFPGAQVRLVRADQRKGKEYAQLCAINEARGEILVFSDVATQFPPEAIRHIVAYFADPVVGAVSSEDRFISQDGSIAGEGAYVKYEMWLRRQESERAGLVGLSGSFFAARREVCQAWDIYSPSDFNTALNCAKAGLIAVTAPDVLGYYRDIVDAKREYQRKVRTALRGMTALARHRAVLSLRHHGLFAVQLWSHKVMRWAVPWAMAVLLVVSLSLHDAGAIYRLALGAQLVFYFIGLAAWLLPPLRNFGPARLVFFFLQVNLALAEAFIRWLRGERMYVWQPSQR